MSNTKNLANLAAVLDDGTSGQVLQSTGSGGVQFADSTGSGVTVHANQAAMLTDAASASEGTLHYETGTNKLYVKQSSGFYLLASITNASPTIDSFSENTGGAGANNLTAGGTFTLTAGSNTVVTINATEPDLETISYSATVTSGTATDVFSSPSFPVTNQSSNVFTLTPVTSGTGGTVTIRFDASDGTNVANVSHSFAIAFVIADSHYTSLLMATDGSAGDNNDITDSSSNNHTITVNGDAHAGTFSPYRHGGYSASFDGGSTVDAVTYGAGIVSYNGSSAFNVGTNDYSVECWIKAASYSTNTYCRIFDFHDGTTLANIELRQSSNTGNLQVAENGSYIITSSNSTPMDGDWHFIQLIRTGGTTTLYIDGTSRGSASSSTNINSISYITVGARNQYSYGFDGQIADFRFSNTARTAGTPTERLTSDSNTKLLVCTKPYLVDESDTATSVSFYSHSNRDDPKLVSIGPYDYEEYSESTNGGSVYFDGTGDYLQLSHTDTLQLGSSDFCIEAWVYINAHKNYNYILSYGVPLQFTVNSSGQLQCYFNTSQNVEVYVTCHGTSTLSTNSWHHVAVSRDGNNLQCYVDGIRENTTDVTGVTFYSSNPTYTPRIGDYGSGGYVFDGYISDLRVVKGTASRTGASFTLPTAPLTAITNTSLLLSGTDAHVIDKSQRNNLKLAGSTAASTDQSKFTGTASLKFYGSNNYALAENVIPIGTGDFTYEGWIYTVSGQTATANTFFDTRSDLTADGFYIMHRTDNSNKFRVGTQGTVFLNSASSYNLDTWHHWALVRSGTTCTFYINGSADTTTFTSSMDITSEKLTLGTSVQGTGNTWVYLQDVRITAGKARYTSNFTVPSAPLKG